MLRRIVPALVLFLLAPVIAEYLLGDLLITQLDALPVLAFMYGGGAILIREWARRTGRGWPTILTLALAYAVLEEGIITQSLFNPNYLGLRMLDYGYVPSLGMSGSWTLFVLSIHVVWSIAVPIAITELMFSERRTTPWLGRIGLSMFFLLFALGAGAITLFTKNKEHYTASPLQLLLSAVVVAALCVMAFVFIKPYGNEEAIPDKAPNPWILGAAVFLLGSAFNVLNDFAPKMQVPAFAEMLLAVLLEMAAIALLVWASNRSGWSNLHRFAIAAGALLVYCWWGFNIDAKLHKSQDFAAHLALVMVMLALLVWTGLRLKPEREQLEP